jgi:DNA-binding LacI/PurR family transcriptional regulator
VQSSIDTFAYLYDDTAANLGTRMTHTIGLVVCEVTNPSCAELAAGIDEAFDQAGWVAFLTAVLPHNDLCALGVMLGLSDLSLTPRGDIAVICLTISRGRDASAAANDRRRRRARDRGGSRSPIGARHQVA